MAQPQEALTLTDRLIIWAGKTKPAPHGEGAERYNHEEMPDPLKKDVRDHIGTVWIQNIASQTPS